MKQQNDTQEVGFAAIDLLGPVQWRHFKLDREPVGKHLLLHDGKDFSRGTVRLTSSAGQCDYACDAKGIGLPAGAQMMDEDSIVWCADFEDMHARMLGMRPMPYVGWF